MQTSSQTFFPFLPTANDLSHFLPIPIAPVSVARDCLGFGPFAYKPLSRRWSLGILTTLRHRSAIVAGRTAEPGHRCQNPHIPRTCLQPRFFLLHHHHPLGLGFGRRGRGKQRHRSLQQFFETLLIVDYSRPERAYFRRSPASLR